MQTWITLAWVDCFVRRIQFNIMCACSEPEFPPVGKTWLKFYASSEKLYRIFWYALRYFPRIMFVELWLIWHFENILVFPFRWFCRVLSLRCVSRATLSSPWEYLKSISSLPRVISEEFIFPRTAMFPVLKGWSSITCKIGSNWNK